MSGPKFLISPGEVAFIGYFFGLSPLEVETWGVSKIFKWNNEAVKLHEKLNPKQTANNGS